MNDDRSEEIEQLRDEAWDNAWRRGRGGRHGPPWLGWVLFTIVVAIMWWQWNMTPVITGGHRGSGTSIHKRR